MKRNSKGAIDMMLVAAIAIVLGVGGLVIYRMTDEASNDDNTSDTTLSEEVTTKDLLFESSNSMVSFPSAWSVDDLTDTLCSSEGNDECPEYVELTSEDGLTVRYIEQLGGFEDLSNCVQYKCNAQTVKAVYDLESDESIQVVVVENILESATDGAVVEETFVEASLYKPTTPDKKVVVGQKFGVDDSYQLSTGVTYGDDYFVLFTTFNTEEGADSELMYASYEEIKDDPSFVQALEILKSFEFKD